MTRSELFTTIDKYVIAHGGTVTSLDESLAKIDLRIAVDEFYEDARRDGEEDGRSDGYADGSADAKKAREEANQAADLATDARDTLARLTDALGWDRIDCARFSSLGVFPPQSGWSISARESMINGQAVAQTKGRTP